MKGFKLGLEISGNVYLSVGVSIKAYVGFKSGLGISGNVHLSVGVRIKAYVGVQIRPGDFRKCTFKCWS